MVRFKGDDRTLFEISVLRHDWRIALVLFSAGGTTLKSMDLRTEPKSRLSGSFIETLYNLGDTQAVEFLGKRMDCINLSYESSELTLLHLACKKENVAMVLAILRCQPNVNAQSTSGHRDTPQRSLRCRSLLKNKIRRFAII